jgi:hypothetical protein
VSSIPGTPAPGTAFVFQKSAPDVRDAFSSNESEASLSAWESGEAFMGRP